MDYLDIKYQTYIDILKEELIPAMGCTEPIALAYCASIVRKVFEVNNIDIKDKVNIDVIVSGNILKNIKSVTVPNTNGLHGIPAAVAVGYVCGDCYKKLEVISTASKKLIDTLPSFIDNNIINIIPCDNDHTLYIEIKAKIKDDLVSVIIQDSHTFVHKVTFNDKVLYFKEKEEKVNVASADKTLLNIIDIIKFGEIVEIVQPIPINENNNIITISEMKAFLNSLFSIKILNASKPDISKPSDKAAWYDAIIYTKKTAKTILAKVVKAKITIIILFCFPPNFL